jgi:hypothetical protein
MMSGFFDTKSFVSVKKPLILSGRNAADAQAGSDICWASF